MELNKEELKNSINHYMFALVKQQGEQIELLKKIIVN